jgi:hypothetical protein
VLAPAGDGRRRGAGDFDEAACAGGHLEGLLAGDLKGGLGLAEGRAGVG